MAHSNFKSLTNVANSNRDTIGNKYDENKLELTDEEVKERVKLLTNQALCSSKRMLNYCDRSEIFGYNATRLLTEQDDKLKNIEKDIDKMGNGLNEVEKNLNDLNNSKCCLDFKTICSVVAASLVSVFISKGRLSQTDSSESDNVSELHSSSDESIKTKKFSLKRMLSAKSLSSLKNENIKSFINRIRLRKVDSTISTVSKNKKTKSLKSLNQSDSEEDYVESINDAKEKLNENLKNIFYKLDDLQTMASDIGYMVNKQNDKIAYMDKRTDLAKKRVKSADKIVLLFPKERPSGSSAVDWCEKNYQIMSSIAEFFNTITNIIFFIVPPLMSFLFKITQGIHIIWFMLVFVGIGSVYFHATLTMAGQMMDELSILWVLMAGYTVLFPDKLLPEYFQHKRMQWYLAFGIATTFITLLCFVNPYLNAYFLMLFGLPIMSVMIYLFKTAPIAVMRLGKRAIFVWFLAIICWIADRVFCDFWLSIKIPYFHASHMSIIFYAYFMTDVRVPHLKPEIAYYPKFFKNELFTLPYIHFKYLKTSKTNKKKFENRKGD
ncbi:alkaline ceramidase [Brachionus plicatilis]|uniref:ceramidase n=1 Tax=Brachionus plicatilis TaxID=10195 RepID=A0A3M7RZC8_BRAPC|nr:alkaline ceramidase [Brachionus plicatilis]